MIRIFPMVSAPVKSLWFLGVVAVVLVLVLGLLGYIAWSTRHVRFEISPAGLRITGDMFGRMIPMKSLVVSEAARLDLSQSPERAPRFRTWGTGLPGYGAGWFRLKNGEKALLFLTDRRTIVRVPTRDGYSVMLSVMEPEAFIQALRRAAGL